jgi:molecular chaperone DnaK
MVKDAESNAAADKEKREKIDVKNQAETLIYQAEKQLGELGDKVAAGDKAKVEGFTAELKAAVEKDDTDAIKATLEQLQQALYAAGASVYQQAGADAAAGAAPGGGNGNGASAAAGSSADDVIDAEFTESK